MKKYLFYFSLLVCVSIGFTQQYETIIDSLEHQLTLSRSADEKMKIYNDLVMHYIHNDITKSQSYNDSLLTLSTKLNSETMKMYAIYNNGVISRMNGEYSSAENFMNEYLKYSKKINDTTQFIKSSFQLATIYVYQDKKEEALSTYLKALQYLEDLKGMQVERGKILNAIGVVYKNTSQYEKAKRYHKKAADIAIKANDSTLLSIVYNGLGIANMKQDSVNVALSYFKKSLTIAERTNNIRVKGYQYRNIGTIYLKNKDYRKAEDYLGKALILRRTMRDKTAIGGALSDLANLYIETNRLNKAEKYINEAIVIFQENKSISSENLMYSYLSTIEAKRGNSQKAMDYLEKYYKTKDSLESVSIKEKLNSLDIKYETEKKDKALVEQQLQIEQQTLDLQKKKSQSTITSILAIFLLASTIFVWFLYKQNKKRKDQEILSLKREQQVKTLESLIEGEEKERLRLAQELHDGVNVDLSAIKYKLTSLIEKNNGVITEAVKMIDKSCEQVRAISHNLVPPALKDFSLVETLEDYCSTTNSIHDVEVTFQYVGKIIEISKKAEINIFRIVQELVNNSLKHAEASEIDVQISYQDNTKIQLTVEDNGKGFDINTANLKGIGLQNINFRVAYLNGKLDVKSDIKGTSYIIDIKTHYIS